ncbi:hypothetical protein D7B24_007572 [Verticillium nonalfalfae]|uniref:Uncharacterized protein n=1 Tax=Verticillium nonalfalfae TaxID=1051616 RepID=A0A3M9Y9S2_9PEZI|nr:uncharacterized protein D7B24_007572 [Verticillium nonalfalfae]RNJ56288.1 hypothetical protein D7B24_007572 [Verticillium nonalfalfae]
MQVLNMFQVLQAYVAVYAAFQGRHNSLDDQIVSDDFGLCTSAPLHQHLHLFRQHPTQTIHTPSPPLPSTRANGLVHRCIVSILLRCPYPDE